MSLTPEGWNNEALFRLLIPFWTEQQFAVKVEPRLGLHIYVHGFGVNYLQYSQQTWMQPHKYYSVALFVSRVTMETLYQAGGGGAMSNTAGALGLADSNVWRATPLEIIFHSSNVILMYFSNRFSRFFFYNADEWNYSVRFQLPLLYGWLITYGCWFVHRHTPVSYDWIWQVRK